MWRGRTSGSAGKGRQETGAGQPYAQAEERLAPVRHVAMPRGHDVSGTFPLKPRCVVPHGSQFPELVPISEGRRQVYVGPNTCPEGRL